MLSAAVRALSRGRRAGWLWLGVLAAAGFLVVIALVTSAVARWWSGPPAIHVGRGPDALAVTPDGRTLYVASDPAGTVTPISVATGVAGRPAHVGRAPVALVMAPDGSTLYVVINGDQGPDVPGAHLVVPVSIATGRAGAPVPLGSGPVAAAVTLDGRTLFVAGSDDKVTPVMAPAGTAGRAFRVVPILDGTWGDAAALAVTPDGSRLYVADESQNAVAAISLKP